MAGQSFRNILRVVSSVNLGEEDYCVKLEEEEVGEEIHLKASSSCRTSKRPKTSLVWKAYDLLKVKDKHGKEVDKIKCKYCGTIYVVDSDGGTGHLMRHKNTYESKHISTPQG